MDALNRLELSLLDLPFEVRARLAVVLAESLDEAAIEEAWEKEAERRYQAYLSGEMKTYPVEDVLAEMRARHRREDATPSAG